MNELLQIPVFPVVLTLAAYQFGALCQKKWKTPLLNPILIGMVIVVVTLKATGMATSDYQAGVSVISWLMTPATVSLAIPMYAQIQALKQNLKAILVGVVAGALACLGVLLLGCLLLGLDRALTIAILPKGITAAIGVSLTELFGGPSAITMLGISVTGICGNIFGESLCKCFGIREPIAQGVALGTASHVTGTARASEMGELQGAVGSLSLVIAGLLTAVLFPALTPILEVLP